MLERAERSVIAGSLGFLQMMWAVLGALSRAGILPDKIPLAAALKVESRGDSARKGRWWPSPWR